MSEDIKDRLTAAFLGQSDHIDRSLFGLARDRIKALEEGLRDVCEAWDWWQVDTYDRCSSVPADAIQEARTLLGGSNGK